MEVHHDKETDIYYVTTGVPWRCSSPGGSFRSTDRSWKYAHANEHAVCRQEKMVEDKSYDESDETVNNSDSVASFDSTGKQKSFRRLITRFAEKTSMVGVPYINNAKFWWAKLIWCIMLLAAMAAMTLHLWYLINQFTNWPKLTKITLGFQALPFPEVTICNTNVMHKGRLDEYKYAYKLIGLVESMAPNKLVPDRYYNYYNHFTKHAPSDKTQTTQRTKDHPTTKGADTVNKESSALSSTRQHIVTPNQNGTTTPTNTNRKTTHYTKRTTQGNGNTRTAPENNKLTSYKENGSTNDTQESNVPHKRWKRFVDSYANIATSISGQGGDDDDDEEELEEEVDKDKDDDEFKGKLDAQRVISDLFTSLYMGIHASDRARLGHNISDMLLSCTFNGRECTPDMFTLHQTSQYGNCWSIRSEKFRSKFSGPSGGLSLILFLEIDSYIKGISTGYGARVQVHEQMTHPFPVDEALFIPSAMETDIAMRMVSLNRLGGRYGDCEDRGSMLAQHGIKYTRRACQMKFKIEKIVEKCRCYDKYADGVGHFITENMKPCITKEEIKCMNKVYKQIMSNEITWECSNPCSEVQYIKTTSQRLWPSDEYALVLLQGVCQKDKVSCTILENIRDDIFQLRNNFLKLNIYFEDLNYENITEEPEIQIQQFLSDVGGAIGLWIGLSILSLCELVQLFVELCDFAVHKSVKVTLAERHKKERKLRVLTRTLDKYRI